MSARPAYADIVDLDRFPIDSLDSEVGRAFIAQCRKDLEEKGLAQLFGFLRPEAVAATLNQVKPLLHKSWRTENLHTCFFTDPDLSVPPDHPLRKELMSSQGALAYDLIPNDCPLKRLYQTDDMLRFVREILGLPKLYRSADPLDGCQIATFKEGDTLAWHFDNSLYSVTLMLQEPEAGGDFEYYPAIRSDDNPNYEGVQKAVEGTLPGKIKIATSPGTLAVFRGHHALHVVTPVQGKTVRINSVFTYGDRPDMRLTELTQNLFYGRVVPPVVENGARL